MQTIQHSARGLGLLSTLNADRFMFAGGIAIALALGAYMSAL